MTERTSLTDRGIQSRDDLNALTFNPDGLIPVVVQDVGTREVLMMAWADREALERTLKTGEMHFWSRSRQELWHKGATSGNTQELVSLHGDCDGDTILALVEPTGPACHTDETTCFGELSKDAPAEVTLPGLWKVLQDRARDLPEDSYTVRLLKDENLRLKKLGEETAELILALGRGETERVAEEAGDLVYHLLVAMLASGATLEDLLEALEERRR